MKFLPLLLVTVLALAACTTQQAFRLEPTNHKTFASTKPLRQGDVVWLRITGLGEKHRLRFHRCGHRCNSAEPVITWERSKIPSNGRITVQVPSDGEYYFWVEDFTDVKGKYGDALVAMSATTSSAGLIIKYNSPLVVVVEGVQSNSSFKPKPLRGSA